MVLLDLGRVAGDDTLLLLDIASERLHGELGGADLTLYKLTEVASALLHDRLEFMLLFVHLALG